MGLINEPKPVSVLTVEEKQAGTKKAFETLSTSLFKQMKDVYLRGRQLMNNNPYGLSRDDVIEGLGSDAEELARFKELLKTCLNSISPDTITDREEA